jgi:hypothetical protein
MTSLVVTAAYRQHPPPSGTSALERASWRSLRKQAGYQVQPEFLQVQVLNDRYQRAHNFDAVLTRETFPFDPDQTARWASRGYPAPDSQNRPC